MKKLSIIGALILLVVFIIPPMLPASVGHSLLEKGMRLEAEFYGLEQYQIDIGEMPITYYSNMASNYENRPTLLLLHGYSADKNVWPRFSKHFHDNFYVLIPDMAGHGETGFQESWDYSTPAQAERMFKFLEKLNVENAHLIGNSMGGLISAHFALKYPKVTLSATLIDPSGVFSPEPSLMDTMLENGRNPFEVNNRREFDEFFEMTMANPPYVPDLMLEAVSDKYQERKLELRHIFSQIHHQDMLEKALDKIQPPVLLLWGAQDQIIHVSSVEIWNAGVPNIQTKVWEDIGHMPMLELPSESAQVVTNFIEKHQDSL